MDQRASSPSPFLKIAGHGIRRVYQAHNEIFAHETAGFDVTSPQHAALTAILQNPGIELTPLCDLIGYDSATMAGLVARLVAKRLVVRRVGKHDRRTRQLWLTAKGEALLRKVSPSANRVHDILLAPLSPAERTAFMAMIERVVVHANAARAADESEILDRAPDAIRRRARREAVATVPDGAVGYKRIDVSLDSSNSCGPDG